MGVKYYDSMGGLGRGKIYLDAQERWLVEEAEVKGRSDIDVKEWKFEDVAKCFPQQKGGIDCGVFLYINADFIADNLPLSYSVSDIPLVRRKITAYLLCGEHSYWI
jgi:Ulp1 family protease